MYLSKSLYVRGLQCTKSLWIKIHNPGILTPPDEKALTKFKDGNEVGRLARQLFPGGREIPLSSPEKQIEKTKEYMEAGINILYEATFVFDDVMVMVDILQINEDKSVNIYEVKSSTKVKRIYIDDLSIQFYVLHGLGFTIKSSNLINMNNTYIREDLLDPAALFNINDVSEDVIALEENISRHITRFKTLLNNDMEDVPIGKHCTTPYKCDAYENCWGNMPENNVFEIAGLSMDRKMALYSMGIRTFDQIRDFSDLSSPQRIQITSELRKEVIINTRAISRFLNGLTYPIYHLDFESFQHAIPQWPGVQPYLHIPFQYSLHIEQKNGDLQHKEFLAEEGMDPRFKLATSLVKAIPTDVTVLAYNMNFEKGIMKRLALSFPQYSDHLMAICQNVRDLMIPFKKKEFYSPKMKGSYSIKYVLPALVPQMSDAYEKLHFIHNGTEAMNVFPRLIEMDKEERGKYRKALLKYCELDTLAMVKILEVLRDSVGEV
ncbi:MAG: DUF2779 domain-containing protein [Spirochaetaceae bacterium]|nr:DUF2779 domain-containing protein [Spirochaetaceae bacterium]